MKTYKLSNNFKSLKFHKWEIQIGSIISQGTTLFSYKNEETTKIERFKSTLGGITITSLTNLNEGMTITTGSILFQYECSHQITINGLCCDCGIKRESSSASLSMIHSLPKMKVEKDIAVEVAKNDLKNLLNSRKLVLLVDLDQTIIHTTCDNVDINAEGIFHYELSHRGLFYHTKYRPGYEKFLENMSKLFELHIVTYGEREYARKIVSFMDSNKKYFHDRILTRNELINPYTKKDNLKSLFPCGDLMVCIIDDRDDVWSYAQNLIWVKPYVYFKNTGDINEPPSKLSKINNNEKTSQESTKKEFENDNDDDDNNKIIKSETSSSASSSSTSESCYNQNIIDCDDYLFYLENILIKIHDEYYKQYDDKKTQSKENDYKISDDEDDVIDESILPDMKKLLPQLRSQVLKNVVITFSGVVPTDYDLIKQKCYHMAISLGAKVNKELIFNPLKDNDQQLETTHLVAANYGTSKVHKSLKMISINETDKKLYIVQPEWLIECYQKWIKCNELDFILTEDYDYKNCLFHQEYNIIQQRNTFNKQQQTTINKIIDSPKRSHSSTFQKTTTTKKQKVEFSLGSSLNSDEDSSDSIKNNNFNFTISNNELDKMDKEVDDLCNDESGNESRDSSKKSSKSEHSLSSSSTSSSSESDNEGSLDDEMLKALERELD